MWSLFPSTLLLCAFGAFALQAPSQQTSQPRDGAKQRDKSNRQQSGSDNGQPSLVPPSAPDSRFVYQPSTTNCECPAKAETPSVWRKAVAPESWPNWLLVGVGIVGTWFALRSLKVGEKAAKAAELNAQAVIDAERAWLLIPQDKIQAPYITPWDQESVQPLRLTHCIFWIRNGGKTPALVLMEKYEMQIGDSRATPPSPDRVYGVTSKMFNPYLITPEETSPRESGLMTGLISPSELRLIKKDKTSFLWLCGFIRYGDVFNATKEGAEHETRFCYLWETHMNTPEPFWHVAGPTEYNKAT
jgi:hypothetical protein